MVGKFQGDGPRADLPMQAKPHSNDQFLIYENHKGSDGE